MPSENQAYLTFSVLPAFSPMAVRWLQPGICSVTGRKEVQNSQTLKGHVSFSKKPRSLTWPLLLLHHCQNSITWLALDHLQEGNEGEGHCSSWLAAQSYHHPQTTSLRMQSTETRVPIRDHLRSTSLTIMFALVLGHLLRDLGTLKEMTLATLSPLSWWEARAIHYRCDSHEKIYNTITRFDLYK